MKRNKLIMAPGPTNVPQVYMDELALEFPHHRTQEFADLMGKLSNNIAKLLHVEDGEVLLFTSSGTGAMESTVVNFFCHGDSVLVIDIGFFGQRYKTLCERFGLNVISLSYQVGETYNLEEVKQAIADNPHIRAIFVTHHETSTGVLNDVEALGQLTAKMEDTLLIVDSISGAIIHPLKMKQWHIDVLSGGSQKGFLIPPGLSFVCLSQKALACIERSTMPRYYWDYQMMLDMAKKGQTPSTPAINLMGAMLKSTEDLLMEGLEKTWNHHQNLRNYLEEVLVKHQLKLAVENPAIRGNVVVPFYLPEGANSLEVCALLETEHNIIIVPGLGPQAAKMVRVGIIGPLNEQDVDIFINALKLTLIKLYNIVIKHVEKKGCHL
ncbi:MAG: pyridoxal-phosphate-dependent aminotransferase family protein [Culicoidibacterales bacterium]